MGKKLEVKKTGRPLKHIDTNLVKELARIHCTRDEIARIVGCHVDTLYARFSDLLQEGMAEGKRSLKRLQWQQAERGNVQMLIWLGKQWLGQKDRQPDETPNTIINIQVNEIP